MKMHKMKVHKQVNELADFFKITNYGDLLKLTFGGDKVLSCLFRIMECEKKFDSKICKGV